MASPFSLSLSPYFLEAKLTYGILPSINTSACVSKRYTAFNLTRPLSQLKVFIGVSKDHQISNSQKCFRLFVWTRIPKDTHPFLSDRTLSNRTIHACWRWHHFQSLPKVSVQFVLSSLVRFLGNPSSILNMCKYIQGYLFQGFFQEPRYKTTWMFIPVRLLQGYLQNQVDIFVQMWEYLWDTWLIGKSNVDSVLWSVLTVESYPHCRWRQVFACICLGYFWKNDRKVF